MATIRLHLGRAPRDFADKTCKRYLLKSQDNQGKSTVQSWPLSTSFLLGEIQKNELYGAENATARVTVGVSLDSCVRAEEPPAFGPVDDVWRKRNTDDFYGANEEDLRRNKPWGCKAETSLPRYWKTFFTAGPSRRPHSPGNRCLCWGHGQLVYVRSYSGNGTQSEPLYKTKTGYYEILEVMPTATHAQIKTAYYKQSFVYHPDRNAGSEAATLRFSEISEAYSVLSNKTLRKKYDRGLLSQSDLAATSRTSRKDPTGSSAKQQTESRRSVMGTDGPGKVFDFDKFFKAHYGEQLQRERRVRERRDEILKKKQETIEDTKLGGMLEVAVGLMVAMALAVLVSLK